MDIKPKGFSVIEIDGFVTEKAVAETRKVLENPKLREKIADHNYEIARCYYSYSVLQRELSNLISKTVGCYV